MIFSEKKLKKNILVLNEQGPTMLPEHTMLYEERFKPNKIMIHFHTCLI